jgi:hypothetical protein
VEIKQADLERDQFRHEFLLETNRINPEMWRELDGDILEMYRRAWSDWRVYGNHRPLSETVDEFAPAAVRELHTWIQAWLEKWNLRASWIERYVLETFRDFACGPSEVRQPCAPGYGLEESELEREPPDINAVLSGGHGFGLAASMKSTKQALKMLQAHKKKLQLAIRAEKVTISSRTDPRPFRWLAQYQVLELTTKKISNNDNLGDADYLAVGKAIKRLAAELGLTLRDGTRGPKK